MLKNIFKTIAAAVILSASFGGNANAIMVTDTFDITQKGGFNFNNTPYGFLSFDPNINVTVTFDYTPIDSGSVYTAVGATSLKVNYSNFPQNSYGFGFTYFPQSGRAEVDEANRFFADFYLESPTQAGMISNNVFTEGVYNTGGYLDQNGNAFYGSGTVTVDSSVSAVPLPQSFGLFAAALGGLALLAYKRRRIV